MRDRKACSHSCEPEPWPAQEELRVAAWWRELQLACERFRLAFLNVVLPDFGRKSFRRPSLKRSLLKNSFAGHGPAPQKLQVIDPPLWGGAMRCQKSVTREFFQQSLKLAPS
jgi:hypothetical protein